MFEQGWTFKRDEGSTGDHLHDASTLGDIYLKTNPKYSGRVTVPVLWDKKRGTIVNNESSEIIRMFNSAFNAPHRRHHRFLSAGAARRDRRHQPARLRDRQ